MTEAEYQDAICKELSLMVPSSEALRIAHARKQGAADGFQHGWHAALARLRAGDSLDELTALVPRPGPTLY